MAIVLLVIGTGLVVSGLALVSLPAALVGGGVLALLAGSDLARPNGPTS